MLEEEGVPVECVAGTSAGSLIGSLFCAGHKWREIRDLAREFDWADLITPTWPRLGIICADKLERALDERLSHVRFEDLRIPFRAVTVDIESGEEVVLHEGPVAPAVRASCSIPGIFEPVELAGRMLVDGGLVNDVPISVVREMGAECVLAVDLNADRVVPRRPANLMDVFYRSLNILVYENARRSRDRAEVTVIPALEGFARHDLTRLDELVAAGEHAMREKLGELRALTA